MNHKLHIIAFVTFDDESGRFTVDMLANPVPALREPLWDCATSVPNRDSARVVMEDGVIASLRAFLDRVSDKIGDSE